MTSGQKRRHSSTQESSQAGPSRREDRSHSGGSSSSQRTVTPSRAQDQRALARSEQAAAQLSSEDIKKLEQECARYLLFSAKKKIPVKRQDLQKCVFKEHSKLLPVVLEGAKKHLKSALSITVEEIDNGKNKYYLLKNILDLPEAQLLINTDKELPQYGLLIIILSLIHMADNSLEEPDLWETLGVMSVVKGEQHPEFGDPEKLINEFVKQMYLEKNKISVAKGQVWQYRWGLRAYHEIKMKDVLRFVATIYDVDIDVWKNQFSTHEGAPEGAT